MLVFFLPRLILPHEESGTDIFKRKKAGYLQLKTLNLTRTLYYDRKLVDPSQECRSVYHCRITVRPPNRTYIGVTSPGIVKSVVLQSRQLCVLRRHKSRRLQRNEIAKQIRHIGVGCKS
jgi:hypothetical protein